MKLLQEMFESSLKEQFTFEKLAARLVSKRLRRQGVELTDDDEREIEKQLTRLSREGLDTAVLRLDRPETPPELEGALLHVDLGEQDVDDFLADFGANLHDMIPGLASETADVLLEQVKRMSRRALRARRRQQRRFESGLHRTWGKPLDLLEAFLALVEEVGDDFNDEYRPQAAQESDMVFDVLTRLHARACQVGHEILALLRSGLADGAHARWRTLHEITVIGLFIESSGSDCAERYMLHEGVESYKAATVYQQHCQALGYQPLSDEELRDLRERCRVLAARFGEPFKEDYGWAAASLGTKKPTFRAIEDAVSLSHLRPLYKWASDNVHGNSRGTLIRLGLLPEMKDQLIAGPSVHGLADPGQGLALSLMQLTTTLLCTRCNLDSLVVVNMLLKLEREVSSEFARVHELLSKAGQPVE